MATEQQNQLFYFQQDPEDIEPQENDILLSLTTTYKQSQTKHNLKQFYRIDDTNKISINYFERDSQIETQNRNIVYTKLAKSRGKEKKLSIEPMNVSKGKEEMLRSRQQGNGEEQKAGTTIFWEDDNQNQQKLENKDTQQNKNINEDSDNDIQTFTFNEDIIYRQQPQDEGNETIQQRTKTDKTLEKKANPQKKSQKQTYKQRTSIRNEEEYQEQDEQYNNYEIKIKPTQIKDIKSFINQPIQKGKVLECTVRRHKQGMNRFFPQYFMYTTNGIKFLMGAKKKSGNTTSNYLISVDKNDLETKGNGYVGKLRSNWMGTQFVGYDSGISPIKKQGEQEERKPLCEVYYEGNFMGTKGPRVMDVYIPKYPQNRINSGTSIKQLHEQRKQAIRLTNKRPKWSPQTKTFVLNFGNRVQLASVKNFLLIEKDKLLNDKHCMLFGKVNSDVYSLDVRYPLTPLQAFQIALTSLDHKLACQ